MITNSHIGKSGRLGNQLFQYAALKSLSLKKEYQLVLPNIRNVNWHGQKCLLDKFNLDYNFNQINFSTNFSFYKESSGEFFDPEYFNLPDGVDILGHFQNLKYFEDYKEIICKELTPISYYQSQAKKLLYQFKEFETVSVHIRRGDNITMNNQNIFGKDPLTLDPTSFWAQYFLKSKEFFKNKKVKYLIFTGGSRNNDDTDDYNWVKNNLDSNNHILFSTPDPILDYALISNCNHNILSPSTSFGWWASYVNQNPNKIQIAPKNYFLNNSDSSRLFTKDYILI